MCAYTHIYIHIYINPPAPCGQQTAKDVTCLPVLSVYSIVVCLIVYYLQSSLIDIYVYITAQDEYFDLFFKWMLDPKRSNLACQPARKSSIA